MTDIVITEEDFRRFREFFYRKTGILFEDSKRYFVDKRLVERMIASGYASFNHYFTFMRFQASGAELQALTNIMTVNETYFFREEYHFKCLVQSILPELTQTKPPGSLIRIWSIPSSSGEEPYSIALYLTEYWSGIDHWDVELISSDIDTDIIHRARQGKYSPRAIQYVPPDLLQTHFVPTADGEYQISDDMRQAVEFTRVNLNEPTDTRSYRGFDVIFLS